MLGFPSEVLEGSFRCIETRFIAGDRNMSLCRKDSAKVLVRAFIRTGVEAPGIGEALDGCGNDAQADQDHQRYEPASVEDVGKPRGVEEAQHRWGVGALNVFRIS